jgi:hypothetical protein
VLDCPPFAGAPHTALHFIYDQENAVSVTQLAQAREERRRRHNVAALALDRLHHHSGHLVRRDEVFENDPFDVVDDRFAIVRLPGLHRQQRAVFVGIRDVNHLPLRQEAAALRDLAGGEAERAERAAMKSPDEAEEIGPPV